MTDLITRLSALTGPDREVDAEIGITIGEWTWSRDKISGLVTWPRMIQYGYPGAKTLTEAVCTISQCPDLPRYTGSLDAALTLEGECDLWILEIIKRAWDKATSGSIRDLSAVKADRVARCVLIVILEARHA